PRRRPWCPHSLPHRGDSSRPRTASRSLQVRGADVALRTGQGSERAGARLEGRRGVSIAPPPGTRQVGVAAHPYQGARWPRARVEMLVAALEATGAAVRVIWDAAERATLLAD